MNRMPQPVLAKNDRRARWLIIIASILVFAAVVALGAIKIDFHPGFDVHVFAKINAVINSVVSLLLVAALAAVKLKQYQWHKRLMLSAILLSVIFLVSYICHHLLAGDTRFGGRGTIRYIYFFILITHIFLAAIILPFILFTAYRALVAEWTVHKRLARITWPIWFYVSVSGVLVYLLISPYYQ